MYGFFFRNEIYPIYINHENTFDADKIHGVLHIARSIIAGHILAMRCQNEHGKGIDIFSILVAIAFHDSGRQGNGVDVWEHDSYMNCLKYLSTGNKGVFLRGSMDSFDAQDKTHYAASLIFKKAPSENDYTYMCVHDADVLEIMRPCCGHGGIQGFRRKELLLYKHFNKVDMELIIKEWWKFIGETESLSQALSVPDVMDKILALISEKKYPVLYKYLD